MWCGWAPRAFPRTSSTVIRSRSRLPGSEPCATRWFGKDDKWEARVSRDRANRAGSRSARLGRQGGRQHEDGKIGALLEIVERGLAIADRGEFTAQQVRRRAVLSRNP